MLELLLVAPDAIMRNPRPFLDGIDAVYEHVTMVEISKETVFSNIITGTWQTHIILNDNEHVGHVISRIAAISSIDKCLTLIHLYNASDKVYDFGELTELLKKYARFHHCSVIRFLTKRDKAFARRTKDLGWEAGYTEFMTRV